MHEELARKSTRGKKVAHQLQPWSIGVAQKVFFEVSHANRFEDARAGELVTGKDTKERHDV
jgi:hypothetical protein